MVMLFMNDKVFHHLEANGFVYTFRLKPHKLGKDWAARYRCGPKAADINITSHMPVGNVNQLRSFVRESGFKSVDEWLEAILKVNTLESHLGNLEGHLYRVELIK